MATPNAESGGWSFADTENLLGGISSIYKKTLDAKIADANATTATQNKRALDSKLNAQTSAPSGFNLDTKTVIIGGVVTVGIIGAIIALK